MLPGRVFNTTYEKEIAIVRTKPQWAILAVVLVAAFAVPAFADDYWIGWLTRLAAVIVAVLGLHILVGLCGLVSIGHAAFMLVGAYIAGVLTTKFGLNGWICLPISCLGAGLVGLVFGLPCFRLKGLYLAISTLAASYIITWCLQHYSSLTGGFAGLTLEPLTLGGIDFADRGPLYILALLLLIVATFVAKNIQRTASGRAFVAIRDNELAAEVGGIAIFRYKMLAFFVACCFAGVAGWIWAYSQLRITPDALRLNDSMLWLGMLIIGGMGSTTGVFMGSVFIKGLQLLFSDYINPFIANFLPSSLTQQVHVALSLIVLGLIILAFMVLEPRGLYSRWERLKMYYRLYPFSSE
jgi:branched-chain amino acid transport system permease protein